MEGTTAAPVAVEASGQNGIGYAPLNFDYWLTTDIDVKTTVTGEARNQATVSIYYGSMMVWSTTLLQTDPTHTITIPLIMGSVTIDANATLTLTVPTQAQNGNVLFSGTLVHQGQQPLPFALYVAQWPLSSSAPK